MEETINIPVEGFKHVKTIPYELYGFQLLKDRRYSWYNKTIPSKDPGILFPLEDGTLVFYASKYVNKYIVDGTNVSLL